MQIQNLQSNTPMFNGRVAIIGKLSRVPSECIEKNKQDLSDLLYSKPFDLYIKERAKDNILDFTVVRPMDFNRKNRRHTRYGIAFSLLEGNNNLLQRVVREAVDEYSKIKQPPTTFKEKAKLVFDRLANKFVKVFQDEEEA